MRFLTESDGLPLSLSQIAGIIMGTVAIISCVVGVGCCYVSTRKTNSVVRARTAVVPTTPHAAGTTVVTTAQIASAAAPVTQPVQQYYPAEVKVGSQEAPPPYPGNGYPTSPPPILQVL